MNPDCPAPAACVGALCDGVLSWPEAAVFLGLFVLFAVIVAVAAHATNDF